jgi:hypothetical protein
MANQRCEPRSGENRLPFVCGAAAMSTLHTLGEIAARWDRGMLIAAFGAIAVLAVAAPAHADNDDAFIQAITGDGISMDRKQIAAAKTGPPPRAAGAVRVQRASGPWWLHLPHSIWGAIGESGATIIKILVAAIAALHTRCHAEG